MTTIRPIIFFHILSGTIVNELPIWLLDLVAAAWHFKAHPVGSNPLGLFLFSFKDKKWIIHLLYYYQLATWLGGWCLIFQASRCGVEPHLERFLFSFKNYTRKQVINWRVSNYITNPASFLSGFKPHLDHFYDLEVKAWHFKLIVAGSNPNYDIFILLQFYPWGQSHMASHVKLL